MARVFRGERVLLTPVARPRRARHVPRARRRPRRRAGLEALRALRAGPERGLRRRAVRDPAHAGPPPVEPARPRLGTLGRVVQHRPRRSSPTRTGSTTRGETTMSTLLADGRPGRAELRLGRRRHRRRDRLHPRPRLPLGRELGVFYVDLTRAILYVLLPLSVLVAPRAGLAGRHPVARRPARRRRPDVPARAGRLAGGDQGARHQRRRLLQRQLGDAVREPDVALELRRDAGDPRDPGGLTATYGRMVEQPAPGLDGLRRDDDAVRRRGRARLRGRVGPDAGDAGGRHPRRRTWRARSSASASPPARCSPRSPRPPRAAP